MEEQALIERNHAMKQQMWDNIQRGKHNHYNKVRMEAEELKENKWE